MATNPTGRPTEFTHESIINAGQSLQAAGRNITGFALRQKVGGGTPQRLKQVWDEHQSDLVAAMIEPVAELPAEVVEIVAALSKTLTERVGVLAMELNNIAVKAAEEKVLEIVRSAEEQRVQAECELADAAETVEGLEAKLEKSQTITSELQTKLTTLQEFHQMQAVEMATLKAQVAAQAESHQEQRKDTAAETLRLIQRIEQVETDRYSASQEAISAREIAAKLSGKVETLQTQADSLMRALSSR
jgi:colicin import membrane protein